MTSLFTESLRGKLVLVRVDWNVPMQSTGKVSDTTRIEVSLETLRHIREEGGMPVVLTHMGRPHGQVVSSLSTRQLIDVVKENFELEGRFFEDIPDRAELEQLIEDDGFDYVLLENMRFWKEEEANDELFAKKLAALGDVYVNEAFSVSHRKHASVYALPTHMKRTALGFYAASEVEHIRGAMETKRHPLVLILGGAKIDTKMGALKKLILPSDTYLLGGGLANTFLAAQGYEVGESLAETEKREEVRHMMLEMEFDEDELYLPSDVVVADEEDALTHVDIMLEGVTPTMHILDIGEQTRELYRELIAKAGTVIWNGPMGKYELSEYNEGTKAIAEALVASPATSLIGGGDTIDAVKRAGIPLEGFTHVSTAGGAMLEFMEHGSLPGLSVIDGHD